MNQPVWWRGGNTQWTVTLWDWCPGFDRKERGRCSDWVLAPLRAQPECRWEAGWEPGKVPIWSARQLEIQEWGKSAGPSPACWGVIDSVEGVRAFREGMQKEKRAQDGILETPIFNDGKEEAERDWGGRLRRIKEAQGGCFLPWQGVQREQMKQGRPAKCLLDFTVR